MSDAAAPAPAPPRAVPLSVPYSARQRRTALLALAAYVALLLAIAPFARLHGPVMPQIVAVFTTGIIVCDLATAFLLLRQLSTTPAWSVLLIGCAYLYSAPMGVAHLLTFPGALLEGRPVIGHSQLAHYVFNTWRFGYSLPILIAAWIGDQALISPRRRRGLERLAPLAVVAGAVLTVALLAWLEPFLPPLIDGDNRFTGLAMILGWAGVAASVLVCAWLWIRLSRRGLFHLWLTLAMTAYCGDILLSTLGGSRFSIGWFAGRASGLVSGCTLFLFFLVQSAAQQKQAAETARVLRERTDSLQAEIIRRSEAEERFAQAQKLEAMGQLTGGIAHDFNNLLAAVIGYLQLLRNRTALDDRAAKWVANALDAAERGTRLTGQLLVFARSQRLELQPVDVTDLLEGAREILLRPLGPNIAARFDLAAAPGRVVAEANQLELAVLNLVLNARDAMPEGGSLTISTRDVAVLGDPELEPGDYIELTVRDTGMGMEPEVLKRAFDPFFSTKGVGKGTGLGLSQVFGFARRVGGTVRMESRPGEGAAVHVFLRRVEEPATEAEPPKTIPARPVLTGPVLVVDDDANVREVMAGLLEDLGFETLCAADGPAGLGIIRRTPPALLIADFAMPGMNGAQLAQEARILAPGMPVVFVTGYADTDAIEEAAGKAAIILRKPFQPNELLAAMARALG
jgi:signal transduction histidine kinase/CheY-like chemotaxis protein